MSYQTNNLAYLADMTTPRARLLAMLVYRRPARSKTEAAFIGRFIKPTGAEADKYGNYWLAIGESKVIWSCHTDSVHAVGGLQTVNVTDGYATATDSTCLGADCAVGVWLMLEMIAAKVPGLYLFHRDEEIGGRGARHIATVYAEFIKRYDYAIAFDRRGCSSVITHQAGGLCASGAFVQSISVMLPLGYGADDSGIYTDTAEYTDLIGECSNISVGYRDEHTSAERLDISHALALRDSMIVFDESRLVCSRQPGEADAPYCFEKDFAWDAYDNSGYQSKGRSARESARAFHGTEYFDLTDLCRRSPDLVADYLEHMGLDVEDIMNWNMG